MGVLTVTGTGFGAYIMGLAAMSPCPLLVYHELGAALMVRILIWPLIFHFIFYKHIISIQIIKLMARVYYIIKIM